MTKEYKICDTTVIQAESLIRFAAGIGYDAVFDTKGRLRSFSAPQFKRSGLAKRSVSTMIDLHNKAPHQVIIDFKNRVKTADDLYHENGLTAVLFASTLKLVKVVNGQGSRKEGLIIQGHMVKFTTKGVYNALKKHIGIEA